MSSADTGSQKVKGRAPGTHRRRPGTPAAGRVLPTGTQAPQFDPRSLPYERFPALVEEARTTLGVDSPQTWQLTADRLTGSLTIRVGVTRPEGTASLEADAQGKVVRRIPAGRPRGTGDSETTRDRGSGCGCGCLEDVSTDEDGHTSTTHTPVVASTTHEGTAVTAYFTSGLPDPAGSYVRDITVHYAPERPRCEPRRTGHAHAASPSGGVCRRGVPVVCAGDV